MEGRVPSGADAEPVVLLLSADSQMEFRVDRAMAAVFVVLPSERQSVLLGFTAGAAVRFAEQLRHGFEELLLDRGDAGGGEAS